MNKFTFTPQRDCANRLARKLGYEGDNTEGKGKISQQRNVQLSVTYWSNQESLDDDIDIILGVTSDEGLMLLEYLQKTPSLLKSLKLENQVPTELFVADDDPIRVIFVEKRKKVYYPIETDPTEVTAYGTVCIFWMND